MSDRIGSCQRCKSVVGIDHKGMIAHHELPAPRAGPYHYSRCLGTGEPPVARLEPTDAARRILERITSDPNRVTKQACDLLLELIRQDASNDPDAIAGLSVSDFQKVIAEVATDLVQERAFR